MPSRGWTGWSRSLWSVSRMADLLRAWIGWRGLGATACGVSGAFIGPTGAGRESGDSSGPGDAGTLRRFRSALSIASCSLQGSRNKPRFRSNRGFPQHMERERKGITQHYYRFLDHFHLITIVSIILCLPLNYCASRHVSASYRPFVLQHLSMQCEISLPINILAK